MWFDPATVRSISFPQRAEQVRTKFPTSLTGEPHRTRYFRSANRGSERSTLLKPGFALAPDFDSGLLGDAKTSFGAVDLIGVTSPNAAVTLQGTSLRTIANAEGKFLFANIPLILGQNQLQVTAQQAGRNRSFVASIERVASENTDMVLEWNAQSLRTIQRQRTGGLFAARTLAIAHAAILDTVNALSGRSSTYRPLPVAAPVGASIDASVVGAAYQVLVQLYPTQKSQLDAALTASLTRIQDTETAEKAGLEFGQAVANGILAARNQDGSTGTLPYRPKIKPGQWRPTPSRFLPAAGFGWQRVAPFVLERGSQFRPAPPPKLTSSAYAKDFDQVKQLGQIDSRSRTVEQAEIARFWLGNLGSLTFPGLWNEIAAQASGKTGETLLQNARLFACLNFALADASIAAWDTKYTYRSWRPVTAIRLAGSDHNPATQADPNWLPFLETPAHPDYVSAHSTFGGAAAAILSHEFGRSYQFTATSLDLPGVQRSFQQFEQAAAEAGISRIYGGIHTMSANRAGLSLGKKVGNYVLKRFFE